MHNRWMNPNPNKFSYLWNFTYHLPFLHYVLYANKQLDNFSLKLYQMLNGINIASVSVDMINKYLLLIWILQLSKWYRCREWILDVTSIATVHICLRNFANFILYIYFYISCCSLVWLVCKFYVCEVKIRKINFFLIQRSKGQSKGTTAKLEDEKKLVKQQEKAYTLNSSPQQEQVMAEVKDNTRNIINNNP